jgi:glycogen debranching enzyme
MMATRARFALGACLAALLPMTGSAAPALPVYHQFVGGFVSAKGEKALVMGYPPGLEVWAYPLQLASDVRIRFRAPGMIDPIDAAPLLRDVIRTPTETIRTYVGADFEVKEHLFVPRRQAGAAIRFEVRGRPDIGIDVRFRPSLDLMWPAALGGQTIAWDTARSGYVETEPLHHFSATIASLEAEAHDGIANRTRAPSYAATSDPLTLTLRPKPAPDGSRQATLVFALDPRSGQDGAAAIRADLPAAEEEARAHAGEVLDRALQIETPDAEVNAALRSAVLALDQSWACNDQLGCGALAGYGPSRPGRRPQYAWFFAGDGMIAMQGMLDAGQFDRAREELAFVTRYQDPKTGMIWHEMSQSAGLVDWVGRYPYMYVHVDISFQYLAAVAAYWKATDDDAFVRAHWANIAKAWRYCLSTIDPGSGLPRIPAGKQGQDEQHELRDDLRLSSAWVGAADGFASLARLTGRGGPARTASAAAERARRSIAASNWDPARRFWLEGHLLSGEPVQAERSDAIGVLDQKVFDADRTGAILDRLGSPDFVTDWGLRSLSARDPAYDPNQYSAGSVWALGTSGAAITFWRHRRADIAWRLWRGLVGWNLLDSAGHLHEVLAGDLDHPEMESVPEQTWSSAGLLSAAVHGLLGLETDAGRRELGFAPQLPENWRTLALRNIRVGGSTVSIAMTSDGHMRTWIIDNAGGPVTARLRGMHGLVVAGRPQAGGADGEVAVSLATGRTVLQDDAPMPAGGSG